MATDNKKTDSGATEARLNNIHGHGGAKARTRMETTLETGHAIKNVHDYMAQRSEIMARESTLAFDYDKSQNASDLEVEVNNIIQTLKSKDKENVYDKAEPRKGYGGQLHPRFPGDRFLSNEELIAKTDIYRVARRLPKGAHLHAHFNACLSPQVLLDIAKGMDRMFITSDLPLVPDDDYVNYFRCGIQFSILPLGKEDPGDLFNAEYKPRQTMNFQEFINNFPRHFTRASVDEWLVEKLVFQEQEAYDFLQTSNG